MDLRDSHVHWDNEKHFSVGALISVTPRWDRRGCKMFPLRATSLFLTLTFMIPVRTAEHAA